MRGRPNHDDIINYVMDINPYIYYINETNDDLETPLIIAVKIGYEKIVSGLIKVGADVNKRDKYGNTALFYAISDAVKYQRYFIVKDLIAAGIDTNIRSYSRKVKYFGDYIHMLSKTPLHYAVELGAAEELIKILIDGGADLNLPDDDGKTPLAFVIITELANKYDIFELLLRYGASLNLKYKGDSYFKLLYKHNIISCYLHIIFKYYNEIITEKCYQENYIVIMFNEQIKLKKQIADLSRENRELKRQIADIGYLPPDSAGAEYLAASANFAKADFAHKK